MIHLGRRLFYVTAWQGIKRPDCNSDFFLVRIRIAYLADVHLRFALPVFDLAAVRDIKLRHDSCENDTGLPELRFLNKTIVQRLIDLVSRVPRVRVLAYRTVQHYRDGGCGPKKMWQDLLVRAVVAGEMLARDNKMLLHLELIDVSDGTQFWGA